MRAPASNSTARGVEAAKIASSTRGEQSERSHRVQTARDDDAYDDDVFAFLDRIDAPLRHLRHCSSCRKTKDALRDFTGELKTCRFCLHDRKRSAKKRRL